LRTDYSNLRRCGSGDRRPPRRPVHLELPMASRRHSRAIGSIVLGLFFFAGLPGLVLADQSTVHAYAAIPTISGTVTAVVGGGAISGIQVVVTPPHKTADSSSGGGAVPFFPILLAGCGLETFMLLALHRPHRR